MTFEEWWKEYAGIGHELDPPMQDTKDAWNAALEEAAKWADMTGPLNAKELRSLKEE